jgi:hypothetical protein
LTKTALIARQVLWFVGLWAAGVLTLGVVAFGLRLLFHPAVHP